MRICDRHEAPTEARERVHLRSDDQSYDLCGECARDLVGFLSQKVPTENPFLDEGYKERLTQAVGDPSQGGGQRPNPKPRRGRAKNPA